MKGEDNIEDNTVEITGEKKKDQGTNETTGSSRTRNYATIVYPESAPNNWVDLLKDQHIPALISPVHDRDLHPDGTVKKNHYHVLIMFSSVKSHRQAKEVFDIVGGVGVEAVKCLPGYARYLVHADDPDKAQYSAADVIAICGADYDAVASMSETYEDTTREIFSYIRDNNITSYAAFVNICLISNPEWFRIAIGRTSFSIRDYIKSLSWENKS